jgi:hypothetical protein
MTLVSTSRCATHEHFVRVPALSGHLRSASSALCETVRKSLVRSPGVTDNGPLVGNVSTMQDRAAVINDKTEQRL